MDDQTEQCWAGLSALWTQSPVNHCRFTVCTLYLYMCCHHNVTSLKSSLQLLLPPHMHCIYTYMYIAHTYIHTHTHIYVHTHSQVWRQRVLHWRTCMTTCTPTSWRRLTQWTTGSAIEMENRGTCSCVVLACFLCHTHPSDLHIYVRTSTSAVHCVTCGRG